MSDATEHELIAPTMLNNRKMDVMRRATATLAILCLTTTIAFAENSKKINNEDLRKLVSGKTIHLRAAVGVVLPITYRANGTMTGRLKSIVANLAGQGPKADKGRWWIKQGQLCQTWTHWLEGQTYCYRLTRDGSTVRWKRNDGRSGTARIEG